jgi:oligogalacturonide transporter
VRYQRIWIFYPAWSKGFALITPVLISISDFTIEIKHEELRKKNYHTCQYRLWPYRYHGGGAFTVIGAWLLFYYTTFVGLSPLQAASIVAIARIVDAIISLFMGSFTDHFYKNTLGKKFGRRRFFLLIGSPLMLVYALLWLNGMNYWFYLSVYLAFEIIAAMVLIPWETLPSEMTKDFNSRTKLSTGRMFLSATGTFLATFIPGLLIGYLGEKVRKPT